MTLEIATDKLPDDEEELYSFIHDYFSGKSVSVVKESVLTKVTLSWPSSRQYYIDPLLCQGLEWWKKGTTVEDIPLAIRKNNKYQLSLNDNWTLLAWSQWLSSKQYKLGEVKEVVILHVDDHLDCLPPLLFKKPNHIYVDPISKREVSLLDSKSIEAAILSGAITIGSFMPLFFHYFDKVQFRHLMPTHRFNRSYRKGNILRSYYNDNLLCTDCSRPALEFQAPDFSGITYHPYLDIEEFLSDIPSGVPVLVHIDMDYFNNRFDGDSDWISHLTIHDPDEISVYKKIQTVIFPITQVKGIEDVTIALSPGFFPVEFWEKSINLINKLL